MVRSGFTSYFIATVVLLTCGQPISAEVIDPTQAKTDAGDTTRWFDIRLLGLEGQGWTDTESPFDRLPKKAKELVRPPTRPACACGLSPTLPRSRPAGR